MAGRICLSSLAAAALTAQLAFAQAPDPLIGFDFDEGEGTTVTSLSGEHEGTFGITPNPDAFVVLSDDTPSGAAGDTSAQFSGSEVLVGSDAENPFLDIVAGPITAEAWVKPEDYPETWIDIFRYGVSYKFGFNSGNLLFTHFGIADYFSEAPVPVGEWTHVAAVWDTGVGITFYVNGEEAAFVETTSEAQALVDNTLVIGGATSGSFYLGLMDRLRVHNAALTPEELDSVADAPKAALDSTLLHYDFSSIPAENGAGNELTVVPQEQTILEDSFPEWTTGPTGQPDDFALYFNGSNARVTVPDPNDSFQLDLDLIFTLEAYVKYGELPQGRSIIMSYGVPGEGGYSFSVTNDPRTVFVTTYGILDAANESSIPDDGDWHHIAVVYDEPAGELRFYVDGELGDTLEYFGGLNFALDRNALYIGVEGFPGSNASVLPYEGYIDRVRVHNAVLTPDQFSIVEVAAVEDWSVF